MKVVWIFRNWQEEYQSQICGVWKLEKDEHSLIFENNIFFNLTLIPVRHIELVIKQTLGKQEESNANYGVGWIWEEVVGRM